MPITKKKELEEIEFKLLLEGIFQHYGFDFRDYAPASMQRRILRFMQEEGIKTMLGLLDRILHDPTCWKRFMASVSVDVTEMFRDPTFFLTIRRMVFPLLQGIPLIRIWNAGCASGKEVYSMAILLKEEGLYDQARIYATDINEAVFKTAQARIFPIRGMQEYTENYIRSGGTASFSDYYIAHYENALFNIDLSQNIIWAQHNLVTDSSFNEFHLILCRNVMIYFNQTLQNHVHNLIYESLSPGGFLGLGNKESLRFTPHEDDYETLDSKERIYRKKEKVASRCPTDSHTVESFHQEDR